MEELIQKALMSDIWAVAGANTDPAKFGNRIYKRLKKAGYTTYALNPVYSEIDGDPCYGSPEALPQTPGCVNIVVSPQKGAALLGPLYDRGVRLLWFQPGSYDRQLLDQAAAMGFDIIFEYCVLVELNALGK